MIILEYIGYDYIILHNNNITIYYICLDMLTMGVSDRMIVRPSAYIPKQVSFFMILFKGLWCFLHLTTQSKIQTIVNGESLHAGGEAVPPAFSMFKI